MPSNQSQLLGQPRLSLDTQTSGLVEDFWVVRPSCLSVALSVRLSCPLPTEGSLAYWKEKLLKESCFANTDLWPCTCRRPNVVADLVFYILFRQRPP